MSPSMRLVGPDGTPTRGFIGAWRAAGALRGLPGRAAIVGQDGRPTGLLVALARAGLGLTLLPGDLVVTADGLPTGEFLRKWASL